MSVRIKITLLFALMVLFILMLVCGSVYYFSYTTRIHNIKVRLTNWAITTGKLLSQSAVFDQQLMLKIDAYTTFAMKNKTVQAYDLTDRRIYAYSDSSLDPIPVKNAILDKSKTGNEVYFTSGSREGVAHYFAQGGFKMVVVAEASDEEGKKKLEQLKTILLLSFTGGLCIAVIAGYFFSKRLLMPLRKIADEVTKISAHNLEDRVKPGSRKDEWGYLSATLNQLLNRLQDSFDIHRRFISNASHELLTPLTAISSQLEITLNREREKEEYKAVMTSVYQDVHRLGKLTQTLLEFAKASGDPGGLEIDLVRIDEILLAIPGDATKMNQHFSVKLTFDDLPDADEELLVFGNEALLFTAIKNVVANACKYSESHLAKVKLSCTGSVITILIENEGDTIATAEKEKIFQPFYRASDKNRYEGFGLGLSLAQQIIKLHKGEISLEPAHINRTVFKVILPSAGSLL